MNRTSAATTRAHLLPDIPAHRPVVELQERVTPGRREQLTHQFKRPSTKSIEPVDIYSYARCPYQKKKQTKRSGAACLRSLPMTIFVLDAVKSKARDQHIHRKGI